MNMHTVDVKPDMNKSVEQTYKVLDEIEHVRQRTGMYAGSTMDQDSEEWIYDYDQLKMIKKRISYNPALVKIFSEILDNAIDESRRSNSLDSIRVMFEDDGSISIQDNGRGIPVEIHQETGQYVPETIFSNLRAGSNFDDTEAAQLIGTNGIGSKLTNILSTEFRIETCDGKKFYRQDFFEGMRKRTEPIIKPGDRNHTKIIFKPDYEFFKIDGLTEGNKLKMIKRVFDAAGTNLNVKFYINSDRIHLKNFDDYVELYVDEFVSDINEKWNVAISSSEGGGFEQVSFINGVETHQGGTHIDYVMIQITNAVREYIQKKYKVKIMPADIRNHMRVYISANINRPKFTSQTKENMVSPVSSYMTSWTVPDKFIKKLVQTEIIQDILHWAQAKQHAEELKELKKLNKEAAKSNPNRVDKFTDALEKKDRHLCKIMFAEGDSARNSVLNARGGNPYIASFALRGKVINTFDRSTAEIIANKEIANILTVTGLQIGQKVTSINDLRFGSLVGMSDQDLDGFHIRSLLFGFFGKYWPELYELGMIYYFQTPIYVAKTAKGETHEFFSVEEYNEWAKKAPKHKAEYYKGLGQFDDEDFERFLENPDKYMVKVKTLCQADIDRFELAFSHEYADERKEWLEDVTYWSVED